MPPGTIVFGPVKRRLPALFVHCHPSERQPELRPSVTIVFDECHVLAVRYRPRDQRKCGNQRLMLRSFVVIGEATAIMANRDNLFVEIEKAVGTPTRRGCRPFFGAHGVTRPTRTKNRVERILREHVLDVRDEQFLMLLLMMPAEDENRFDVIEQFLIGIGKQILDMRIDRSAITLRFPYRWARPAWISFAQVAPVHVTGRVVVR